MAGKSVAFYLTEEAVAWLDRRADEMKKELGFAVNGSKVVEGLIQAEIKKEKAF